MAQHQRIWQTACGQHQRSSLVVVFVLLTLLVPSTRQSTLGDRAFPVAAARAWNKQSASTDQDRLLSDNIPTPNQGLSFTSVIQLTEVYHCPSSRWRTELEHVFLIC